MHQLMHLFRACPALHTRARRPYMGWLEVLIMTALHTREAASSTSTQALQNARLSQPDRHGARGGAWLNRAFCGATGAYAGPVLVLVAYMSWPTGLSISKWIMSAWPSVPMKVSTG